MPPMDASVIVPARNAEATLPRTLMALAEQETAAEYEVIVIDDGSTDRTSEIAQAASAPVKAFAQPPSGPAAARNRGAARASARVLAFCDADVYPTARWLDSGLQALAESDIVQGRVIPDPQARLGPFDRTVWVTAQAGLWEAANLFVRRELFDRVSGFEDWLVPSRGKALAEDVWFGYCAQRMGARAAFSADALAYHEVFRRSWRGYAAERWRLSHFPAIVGRVPELRRAFLYRHLFLNRRTARLDLAVVGGVLARATGSGWPWLAAAPYLRTLWVEAHRGETPSRSWAAVGAADLAADLVGLSALAYGSLRHACPLL